MVKEFTVAEWHKMVENNPSCYRLSFINMLIRQNTPLDLELINSGFTLPYRIYIFKRMYCLYQSNDLDEAQRVFARLQTRLAGPPPEYTTAY